MRRRSDAALGRQATARTPYARVAAVWAGQMRLLLPPARCCCYPAAYLAWLLSCPFWLPCHALTLLRPAPPPRAPGQSESEGLVTPAARAAAEEAGAPGRRADGKDA